MKRKSFLQKAGIAAAALTVLPGSELFVANETKVKAIMIGVGLRGQNHLDLLLRRADVDLVGICDIDDRMLATSKSTYACNQQKHDYKSREKNASNFYRRCLCLEKNAGTKKY